MWKKILSISLLFLMTFGLLVHDADARRFGGGRSFGYSRSASSFTKSPSSAITQPGRTGKSAFSASRWMGPALGLLAGGILGSMLMQNGVMSGLMTWLLVGGVLMLVIQFFRSRLQPQSAYRPQPNNNHFAQAAAAQFMRNASSSAVPAMEFDQAGFLRDAKVQFIRMQAAYDNKNLNDIREFTTPEVFAEIQMQIHERGQADNVTHVMSVETELLDVTTESQAMGGVDRPIQYASVRFTGLIQEERNQAAENINEIWHFKKEGAESRWLIAGVQQP